MLLHIAYKAEKGMDLRQENSIAKVYLAHMVHHVIDTAIQLHGALGYSQDTIAGELVHPGALAAAGRRTRRGAPMEGRPQRHQGVPPARHHGKRRGRRFDLMLLLSFRAATNAIRPMVRPRDWTPHRYAECSSTDEAHQTTSIPDRRARRVVRNDDECTDNSAALLALHRLPADVAAAESFRPLDAIDRRHRRAAALRATVLPSAQTLSTRPPLARIRPSVALWCRRGRSRRPRSCAASSRPSISVPLA